VNESQRAVTEEATSPQAGGVDAPRRRKKRYRHAACPKGVPLERDALRDPRLNNTDAALLAVFIWLSTNEGEVSLKLVAEWLRIHRTTASRSAKKLRRLKFLDDDHQPTRNWKGHFQIPKGKKPAKGHVFFSFEDLCSFAQGRKENIAWQVMQSFSTLEKVKPTVDKRGRFEVESKLLATMLGVKSPQTSLGRLYALGQMHLIRVTRTKGHAAMVEIIPERERRPTPVVQRAHRKAKPTKPPKPRVGEPSAPAADDDAVRAARAEASKVALEQARARIAEGARREHQRKAEELAKKAADELELRAQGSPPFFR